MEQMMGISGPQGLTNTQIGMPPATDPQAQAQMAAQGAEAQQAAAPAAPAAKPPSMVPSDIAILLGESFNRAKLEAGKHLAEYMGPTRGSVNAKQSDLLRVWRKRNPDIDPLYEKFVNKLSDEEIMYAMYPGRRALIRFGRRTYTEQVVFAEMMAELDRNPKFDDLDEEEETPEGESTYIPPQAKFPSQGESQFKRKRQEALNPPDEDEPEEED